MSKMIPEGWSSDQLGAYVSESVAGEWGSEPVGDDNDIPILRSTNFTASGTIDYTKLVYRNVDERKRLAKSLKVGDIVLEKSGGSPTQPVGRVVYFENESTFLFSNFTQKLSPVEGCDSKFLFYKFYSEYQNGTVLKFQQQTTGIINFQLAEYLTYKSIFPPLSEQQKIATILSSVDDVIEKTRAQIDKLKDLKTGMMQELLTKGIGHTEFKDSPVGRIPANWNVVTLKQLLSEKPQYGANASSVPLVRGNPRYLRITDILDDGSLDDETAVGICPLNSEGYYLAQDDLVIARTGNTVGKSYIHSGNFDLVYAGYLIKFVIDESLAIPNFIFWFTQSYAYQEWLKSMMRVGAQPNINASEYSSMLLPLPYLDEQFKITEILETTQSKLRLCQLRLVKLSNIKKALMQDLLTGKVRVNVD